MDFELSGCALDCLVLWQAEAETKGCDRISFGLYSQCFDMINLSFM